MSKKKATKAKPTKSPSAPTKSTSTRARVGKAKPKKAVKTKAVKAKAATRPAASSSTAKAGSAPTGAPVFEAKAVRELARIANEYDLQELEVKPDGSIRIGRASAPRAVAPTVQEVAPVAAAPLALVPPPQAEAEAAAADDDAVMISSPFVGTFYRAPSPDADAFVDVGQVIRKGQVVCIVEAMKLMNEIEAEEDGKLAEILVKNGEHVEYGQPLFRLSKV